MGCKEMSNLVDRMDVLIGRFDNSVNIFGGLQTESFTQQHAQGGDHMGVLVTNNFAESHIGQVPGLEVVTTTGYSDEDIAEEEESNRDEEGELEQNNASDHVMTLDSYGKLR